MNRFATTLHRYLHVSGEEGATVEELAHWTGFTPAVMGECLTGLREAGHIVPTSETRDCGLLPASPVWRAA